MTKIADKIKKLLNLAESSNEHEAKAAANMAQELMVKHNLKAMDLVSKEYDDSYLDEYSRESVEHKYVNDLLQRFFFVNIVSCRQSARCEKTKRIKRITKLQVFGTTENVEIASYTYQFLLHAFSRLWKQYKSETGASTASKQSFMNGLWKGLKEQLSETRRKVENETGLVVVKDHGIDQYQREKIGSTRNQKRSVYGSRDHGALESGREQGKNLRISRGINQGHSGGVLALN